MGFKLPGMGRKKDKFPTTQNVGRVDKFAHALLTSPDPKAAPFQKNGIQLRELKGAVYIVPAKPGKRAAQRHEKALLYLADHFGSQVNQRAYGEFGQDGKNSNAIQAQAHLLAQANKGSFSLEALCDALEPVSSARRCANARQVSEVVVREARHLGHEGRADAADVDVRQAGDWFDPKQQSEAFELTGEWIGLFQDLCAEASAHPSQGRRFLNRRFEETHGFVSCVWETMGVEPARDTDMTLDTLGHQLLVAPEQRMRYLTSLIEDLHKMPCVNDQQEAHRNRQLIRRSAELMRTIRQAVEQRALVGNWLANELAPTLPGRLGQSAVAAGVNAVNLAARDMEPGSPFMLAYEWAAQNLRSAINERAAAQTKARCDEVLSAALSLVSTDLATGALGPALPPLTAEASSKAVAACDDARKRADAAAQRVEAWMWALPAQAPNADLAEQLRNGLQSAWAMFADDHGLPSDHAFAGLFNELPGELNRLSQELDELRSAHEATPTGPLHERIVACSEKIVRLSSVYVGGLAAIGSFLTNAALSHRWPRQWRNDAMACGAALVQLAQTLVAPASHLMQIYNGARNAFQGARKGSTGTLPEPQVQGGTTSRSATEQTVPAELPPGEYTVHYAEPRPRNGPYYVFRVPAPSAEPVPLDAPRHRNFVRGSVAADGISGGGVADIPVGKVQLGRQRRGSADASSGRARETLTKTLRSKSVGAQSEQPLGEQSTAFKAHLSLLTTPIHTRREARAQAVDEEFHSMRAEWEHTNQRWDPVVDVRNADTSAELDRRLFSMSGEEKTLIENSKDEGTHASRAPSALPKRGRAANGSAQKIAAAKPLTPQLRRADAERAIKDALRTADEQLSRLEKNLPFARNRKTPVQANAIKTIERQLAADQDTRGIHTEYLRLTLAGLPGVVKARYDELRKLGEGHSSPGNSAPRDKKMVELSRALEEDIRQYLARLKKVGELLSHLGVPENMEPLLAGRELGEFKELADSLSDCGRSLFELALAEEVADSPLMAMREDIRALGQAAQQRLEEQQRLEALQRLREERRRQGGGFERTEPRAF